MLVPSSRLSSTADLRTLCSDILSSTISEADKYQVGLTKIFFRAGLLARFEQLRTNRLNELTTLIQKNVRRYIAQRDYKRLQKSAVGLQALWRGKDARKRAQAMRQDRAAVQIQKAARGYLERSRFQRARQAVLAVQSSEFPLLSLVTRTSNADPLDLCYSVARGQHVRRTYKEERKTQAVVALQALIRGW